MSGFSAVGSDAIGSSSPPKPASVVTPPPGPVGVNASSVSAARKVTFGGGVRVVIFQGSKKTVRF